MTRTLHLTLVAALALLLAACGTSTGPGTGLSGGEDDPTIAAESGSELETPAGQTAEAGTSAAATDTQAAGTSTPGGQPIPVEGDGGIGDGAGPLDASEPPDFGVSSETDSTSVTPYTYCWSDPAAGAGLCADGFPQVGAAVAVDSQLVVTFEPGALTAELGAADPQDDATRERIVLPVTQENPGVYLIDVSVAPPGPAGLWLFWDGEQGDAAAFVPLDVA